MKHVRGAKVCAAGARTWFAKRPELSWQTFLDGGYTVDDIRPHSDAIADRVIAYAEKDAANG